eukprot:SAG11_NODE_1518_length_4761_cov_2.905405_4_plen_54_part_00
MVVNSTMPYRSLSKFGIDFLNKFEAAACPSPFLQVRSHPQPQLQVPSQPPEAW